MSDAQDAPNHAPTPEAPGLSRADRALIWQITLAYVAGTGEDLRTCYARAVTELTTWYDDRDAGRPMGWRTPSGHVAVVRAIGDPVLTPDTRIG